MTTKIEFFIGGGLFSHYGILLESISEWVRKGVITDSDVLYIDSSTRAPTNQKSRHRRELEHVGFNVFDHILDQQGTNIKRVLTTNQKPPIYPHEFEKKKQRYQEISKKFLKIHPELMKHSSDFAAKNFVSGKTLGVHMRLTDMNRCHQNYGNVFFEDYKAKIDQILGKHQIDKIFVASDNHESIDKLKKVYSNKNLFF